MVKQYILFLESSSEEDKFKERIAFYKVVESFEDLEKLDLYKNKLQKYGIKFYSHLVTTSEPTLPSLKEKGYFFENVRYYSDFQEFLTLAKNPSELKAMDVARYILLLQPVSPLKLQKLLYICYERFYRKTGRFMFGEKFLAFDHGPVVRDVFDQYKGKREILLIEDDKSVYSVSNEAISPITYRLSMVEDGKEIKDIVKSTIIEYKACSAWEMVDITHEEETAWDHAYNEGRNTEITEDIILKAKPTK
ncbi:MAG: type II toxin-antitoxin system antitoxin SocA domain-containing protein [Staphylococcus pseudoxylosus]|uniref:Panacea domain-containing protein n=1 Tax=Staphylococcus pseudoxylosus TaxID=2282419 RepID=UPI0031F67310